jgi:DNA repair protein RecO (recombination protein O)
VYWEDVAITLKTARFGEKSYIVTVLSQQHGLHKALLRYGKPPLPGDVVRATWIARLREQLGVWRFDIEFSYSPFFMRDRAKLSVFIFACEVLCAVLDERTPHVHVFDGVLSFFEQLRISTVSADWIAYYLLFEAFLLKQIGFGYERCDVAASSCINTFVNTSSGQKILNKNEVRKALMSNGCHFEQMLGHSPFVISCRNKMIEDILCSIEDCSC